MRRKQRKIRQTNKTTIFRFWNDSKEYACLIASSTEIPNYRLKEIFDRNFVGKKDINNLKYNISDFKKLDNNITYEVKLAKELGDVR